MGIKGIYRSDTRLGRPLRMGLQVLLFALLLALYGWGSARRHAENPQDRLMPTMGKIADAFHRTALEEDRKGELRLWRDTAASGRRFITAFAIILLAVPLGLHMGVFPFAEALLRPFVVFLHKIPAICVLPILFIVFGLGETSKIAIIVLGVFPSVALDAYLRAQAVPRELIHKAQSLAATEQEVAWRVVLPQIWPKTLDTIRLNIGPAVMLLIAAEAIAASEGLGYRIFVVRRYVAMDIIIAYVLWMTAILFTLDYAIQWWIRKRYRWLDQ